MSASWQGRGRRGAGGLNVSPATETQAWGITPFQVLAATVAIIGVTAVVGLPTILTAFAGQEGWLAALAALPGGFIPLLLLYDLDRRHPGLTLAEQARRALGPLGGAAACLPALLLLLSTAPLGLHQQGDFLALEALPRTPDVVVAGLLIIVPLYAARQGPEVLARLSEIGAPVGIAAVLFIVVFSIRTVNLENLRPVVAQGWPPLLQAAAPAAAWYAETAVLGFLLPFRGRARGASWLAAAGGLTVSAVLVSLVTVWALAVFGPLAARVPYAVFQVTRVASVAEFLTHMDSLLVVAWMGGEMARLGLWLFLLCLALSQCMGLRDYRPLTLPLACFCVIAALRWFSSDAAFQSWIRHVWPCWGLILGIGSPLVVWLAVALRDAAAARGRNRRAPRAGG